MINIKVNLPCFFGLFLIIYFCELITVIYLCDHPIFHTYGNEWFCGKSSIGISKTKFRQYCQISKTAYAFSEVPQ